MVGIKVVYKTELKKNKKVGIRSKILNGVGSIPTTEKGEFWFDTTELQAKGFKIGNYYTVELKEKEINGTIYYDLLSMKKVEKELKQLDRNIVIELQSARRDAVKILSTRNVQNFTNKDCIRILEDLTEDLYRMNKRIYSKVV